MANEVYEAPVGGLRLRPSHPGRTIAAEIASREMSAHALALALRVPANRITAIINGRRGISAETALRLGRYFGTGARFWINLQSQYDLAIAEQEFGAKVEEEVQASLLTG